MALSDRQRVRLAQLVAADLDGGFIEVVSDTETARVAIASVTMNGAEVTATGAFGQLEGNFAWTERRLLNANGELVDVERQDFGRKATGMVWSVEAAILISEEQ